MPSALTPRRAIEIYCDAFARRAPEEMETLFAEDAVFDLPLNDARLHGCERILRETRTAIRGLKNIEVVLDHITEQGSTAFAEGYFYAEHIGIPPYVDGRPARLDFKFVAVAVIE